MTGVQTCALPISVAAAPAGVVTEREWRRMEKANLLAALAAAKGKVSGPGGAAEMLGVHPATLASRLRAAGKSVKD